MYRGYRVVAFVPAGRKQTLEVLFKYFMKNQDVGNGKGILDEVQLWQNTQVQEDLDYMKNTTNDLLKLYHLPKQYEFIKQPIQHNTGKFYEYTQDPNTIYIRFDDDIIYVDDDFFRNLCDFRIDNPDYFLVFANIWNNAIISWIHQQLGNLDTHLGVCEPYCMCLIGWGSPRFAQYIHEVLLEKINTNKVSDLYFDRAELRADISGAEKDIANKRFVVPANRFSISCFAYFGKDFEEFKGELELLPSDHYPTQAIYKKDNKEYALDEEVWLTETYPARTGRKSVICGNAIVSHYTFSPYQSPYIKSSTDILDRYAEIARKKQSAAYYDTLLPSGKN